MVTLEDSSRNVHAQVAQRASKQSHLGFGLGLGHGFGCGLGLGLRLGLGLGLQLGFGLGLGLGLGSGWLMEDLSANPLSRPDRIGWLMEDSRESYRGPQASAAILTNHSAHAARSRCLIPSSTRPICLSQVSRPYQTLVGGLCRDSCGL